MYPVGYYSNDFWIEYNTTKGNGSLLCTGTHIFENHKDINVTVTPNKFVVGENVVTISFSSPVNGWLEYYVDGYGSIVYDNMYEDDSGATVVELNTSSVKRTIEDLSVGVHEIRVFFERYSDWQWDEDLYGPDPYKFSKIFTVNLTEWNPTYTQLATQITSSKVTTVYNVAQKVTFTLKDENNHVLSGENVTVNFNGKTYNKVTNANGQVSVDVSASLVPKTYRATIQFAGDESYKASSGSASVVVSKATPKLTAAKKTFKKSVAKKVYKVTLKDNLGKAINKAKVTLKVNGKTYTATTSKGTATFKITNLKKKGTFTAVVKYGGNSYYNAKTVNVKITVK